MVRHGRRKSVGEAGVPLMKTEKRQDGTVKILDVVLLGFVPPLGFSRLSLGIGLR
jgi:hypothetical protein